MPRPLFQTSRQPSPSRPARRRIRYRSKALLPGPPPGRVGEGAAATRQRVSAALGTGSPPTRSMKAVTPDASAASASRRLAVRSSKGAGPRNSTTSDPKAGQRSASTAARNSMASSTIMPISSRDGSMPNAANPGP